jgi:hypothetical protein
MPLRTEIASQLVGQGTFTWTSEGLPGVCERQIASVRQTAIIMRRCLSITNLVPLDLFRFRHHRPVQIARV